MCFKVRLTNAFEKSSETMKKNPLIAIKTNYAKSEIDQMMDMLYPAGDRAAPCWRRENDIDSVMRTDIDYRHRSPKNDN